MINATTVLANAATNARTIRAMYQREGLCPCAASSQSLWKFKMFLENMMYPSKMIAAISSETEVRIRKPNMT